MPIVRRSRPRRPPLDPFVVLGIARDADVEAIHAARRELAKRAHPDAGGSVEAMQQLNEAAEAAIEAVRTPARGTTGRGSRAPAAPAPRRQRRPTPGGVRQDHPSFTIEALPAEAFEGVLLAAATLGEILDDEPPYLLEMVFSGPSPAWCRLELVPDAGASPVSLTTARIEGHPAPDVLEIRDRWIDALNRVDWSDLGPRLPS